MRWDLILIGCTFALFSLGALGMAAWHTWKFEHRRHQTGADRACDRV